MSRQKPIILYSFIILIILVGLGLFIFKDNVADQLLNYDINGPVVNASKGSNDLKLDILRDSRIKALKNYISIFNYDDLDKSQEIIMANAGKQSDVVISNPEATTSTSTTKSLIRVRVGNSNPFLVIKKAVVK